MQVSRPSGAGKRSFVHLRTAAAVAALIAALSPVEARHLPAGPRGSSGGDQPHGPGGGHGRGQAGRTRAALYEVLTVDAATDRAAVEAVSARLGPALAGTSGRLLVNAGDPIATVGTGPSHVVVIVFDDVGSAQAWQASDAARSIMADLGKAGTVRMISVGGIADPGARPSVSMEALGPGKSLRVIAVPKIEDICKGC